MIAVSFLGFLAAFVVIGVLSHRYAQPSRRSYLLADQNVKPWLAGLSAIATNNSGYMFIGVVGYTYVTGLPATWLMFGWIVGDFVASSVIHRRLREASRAGAGDTFAGVISRWQGIDHAWVRRLGAVVTILFLGTYSAAQLTAGSKALHVLFDWPLEIGALIGAGIVLVYCLAGGIRASIWTDAAQSIVMIVSMSVLLLAAVAVLGGPAEAWGALTAVSPHYMSLFPPELPGGDINGPLLFVPRLAFCRLQRGRPASHHDPNHGGRASRSDQSGAALLLSLVHRLLLRGERCGPALEGAVTRCRGLRRRAGAADDSRSICCTRSRSVSFWPGIFAATMSTADSLILSCAGSLSEDLARLPHNVWVPKVATVLVTGFALWLALTDSRSVFDLVISSWAVLAACFGPLLTVLALGQRPGQRLSLAMMVTGIAVVYVWTRFDVLSHYYEGMLAICCGFVVFLIGKGLGFTQEGRGKAVNAAPSLE